jgi:hypothetical protein
MGRSNDWLAYLQMLSEQSRDLAQYANVYASQWARDVRCVRQGVEHRRVGESINKGKDEWLQAGFVTHQPLRK